MRLPRPRGRCEGTGTREKVPGEGSSPRCGSAPCLFPVTAGVLFWFFYLGGNAVRTGACPPPPNPCNLSVLRGLRLAGRSILEEAKGSVRQHFVLFQEKPLG